MTASSEEATSRLPEEAILMGWLSALSCASLQVPMCSHAAKFAFRGAQRSSETLFGDGMAVGGLLDPRFLSSDER